VGYASDKWRPVVEDIGIAGRPLFDRFLEGLMRLPILDEVWLVVDGLTPGALFEFQALLIPAIVNKNHLR
jgi:hypothetical protein